MKKICVCAFALFLCCFSGHSQIINRYDYKMMGDTLDIKETADKVYFRIGSEVSTDKIDLVLDKSKLQDFRKAFRQANLKYKEWKKVATANNVRFLNKEMDGITFPRVAITWTGKADVGLLKDYELPTPYMFIDGDKYNLCIMCEIELRDKMSERMKELKGIQEPTIAVLRFVSEKETNAFENILTNKITESLFK